MNETASGYDAIEARARALRSRLEGQAIIGVFLPPDMTLEAIHPTQCDDAIWSPYAGIATYGNRTALILPGRPEGVDQDRIFAIRVLRALGGRALVIADRCAAVRSRFPVGSLVVIADHINLTGTNPLAGPNDERIGPRFPGMTEPYEHRRIEQVERVAVEEGRTIQRCVYAGVNAPMTTAECRLLAYVGADVYGFGIVPDAIAAIHTGLSVAAIASVMVSRTPDGPTSQQMEYEGAMSTSDDMTRVLMRLIRSE